MSEPTGVNDKLITALTRLATVIVQAVETNTNLQSISGTILEWQSETNSKLESLRTEIGGLQNVLGVAAGGPTTTLAGLLVQIATNTSCVQRACGPGGDDAEGCIEPLISYGQLESSDYGNRVFATWLVGELPAGLIEGSFLATDVHNAQIIHTATIGWKAFVQSNGSASYSINPDSGDTLTTNQWNDIDNWQDMAFSVPAGADIKVFLCNPTAASWLDCVELSSTQTVITAPGGSTSTIQMISMQDLVGVGYTDRVQNAYGTDYFISSVDGWVTSDDWHGVKVTLVSGTNARFWYQRANLSFEAYGLHTIGATFTIPETTIAAGIDGFGEGTETAFTVEVCPAEEL